MKRLVSHVYLVCLVELETNQMNTTNQVNQVNSSRQSHSAFLRGSVLLSHSTEFVAGTHEDHWISGRPASFFLSMLVRTRV